MVRQALSKDMDRDQSFLECPDVRRVWILILLASVLRQAAVCSESAVSNSLTRLDPVPPCAALLAAAQANRIPLEGIDPPGQDDRLDPGDSVSALITLFQKDGRRSQWLVYLEVVAPNTEEQARKQPPPQTFYSSFGTKLKCVSSPAFVLVRTLGPFVESPKGSKPQKAGEKSARFALNKGFLSLGLNHTAEALYALKQTKAHGKMWVRNVPFTETELAEGRKVAATLELTREQDHAFIGGIPALQSYFEVIQNTPGLSDILFDILDLPSAWSMIRNGGIKDVEFHFERERVEEAKGGGWVVHDFGPAYHLPFVIKLNTRPALNLTFVVTSPNPPLLACAGVVGLLAEKPGQTQNYLTLRVLSARRAAKD
jgi:hypothetical protein